MKPMVAAASQTLITLAERPELEAQIPRLHSESWPVFILADPIEEYLTWRRDDGASIDPWFRIHQRLGAEALSIAPRSMIIPGTVAQWEAWSGQQFPQIGSYPVTGALSLIHSDCAQDTGLYVEPNVWVHYPRLA
jgi:hypothetical protein